MRTQPYHNKRIIQLIRVLYFSGGSNSLSARFHHRFPTGFAHDGYGVMECEVPIAMVALVATAVSTYLLYIECAHLDHQLYASIHEWRTGTRQAVEFSASAYLDVYLGHVNTLLLIQQKQGNAYHTIMADIYSKAR